MGTNYYVHNPLCPNCGRCDEPLHVGKSSAGWYFALHVIPEKGLNSLSDWMEYWHKEGRLIKNEYGETLTTDEMVSIITERKGKISRENFADPFYETLDELLVVNRALLTDKGLLRSKIDGRRCVGHGEGTWDLLARDFS